MRYRTYLLFGSPGAGKGTQGKALGTLPNFFHCACGDVFRSLKMDTRIGQIFQEYSRRGELVPDGPTVELWQQYVQERIAAGRFRPEQDTLILDGIPRNLTQAELLKNQLDVQAIFKLKCTRPEVLIERLQRRALKEGRQDDTQLSVIRNRLEVYERESRPVLEFYEPKLVHYIEATQPPAKVLFDILAVILKIQKAQEAQDSLATVRSSIAA